MAELIGVISGVAAIAGVGFKLFKSLNDLAGSIGDAGKEISLIATEIRIFAEVLVVVRASLNDQVMAKARSPIIESTIGVMPGLIKQCEIVYDGINDVLSALKPYKADTYRLKSKLKWLQEKSRVIALRGYLEPLKSSLSLLLILLKNEIADKKQEPDNIRQILQEELKFAFKEAKSQPELLDEELARTEIDPLDTDLVPLLEKQLSISSRPLHTIKVAAQAMIMVHESNPIPMVRYQPPQVSQEEPTTYGPSKVSTSNEVIMDFNRMGDAMSQVSRIADDGTESLGWRKSQLAESDAASNPKKRRRLLLSIEETDSATDHRDLDDEEPLTSFWFSDHESNPPEAQGAHELQAEVFMKMQNLRERDWQARSDERNRMILRWQSTIGSPPESPTR